MTIGKTVGNHTVTGHWCLQFKLRAINLKPARLTLGLTLHLKSRMRTQV